MVTKKNVFFRSPSFRLFLKAATRRSVILGGGYLTHSGLPPLSRLFSKSRPSRRYSLFHPSRSFFISGKQEDTLASGWW